ncbi:hypothetical protein D3C86_1878730 [compost metagenome]
MSYSAINGVGQAYCTCFCSPEYQTRAIGCTFTGRLILSRASAGSAAIFSYSCSRRSIHCSRDQGAIVRGDLRLFSSIDSTSLRVKFLMMCLFAQPKRKVAGLRSRVSER